MEKDAQGGGKALIQATRPFAVESVRQSWWYAISTWVCLATALFAAVTLTWWPLRLAVSVLAGLLIVRGFILYHDHMHGALLRQSKIGRVLMNIYGVLVLTPPRVWRQTHNYHHAHNAKIIGSHVGSFPMMTVDMWAKASFQQRLLYRVARHPLTIALGYGAIFLYGMCISGFLRRPAKNWDSALALVVHAALIVGIWMYAGVDVLLFAFVFPLIVACAVGAYLFYAQHNFEGMHLQPREDWNYVSAALDSSSYMKLGPVMNWFTGNIGYHHVHHLNPTIPFYRLPEAMAAIPELGQAKVTTLRPADIASTFRLKLWDPKGQRMVPFPS